MTTETQIVIEKKYRHNKCKRIAKENGYCNICIQLNIRLCNHCSGFLK